MKRRLVLLIIPLVLLGVGETQAQVPHKFKPSTPANASEVNENFSYLDGAVNSVGKKLDDLWGRLGREFQTKALRVDNRLDIPRGVLQLEGSGSRRDGLVDIKNGMINGVNTNVHINGHFALGGPTDRSVPPGVPFFSNVTLTLVPFAGEVPLAIGDDKGHSVIMSVDGRGNIRKSGSVNFVVEHPNDFTKEIVYVSLEGPEAGTYIRGTADLVDGKAVIELPAHFGLVTNEEGLTVQLTPLGTWLQLYVAEQSPQQLVVHEATGKGGSFHYLIQGIRRGYENHQVIQDKRR